uniref:Uncharacterized protein n=1 Tax=viral metagenome TaxID=1070528 RepID=A0A6C0JWA0_9ZZZZ
MSRSSKVMPIEGGEDMETAPDEPKFFFRNAY